MSKDTLHILSSAKKLIAWAMQQDVLKCLWSPVSSKQAGNATVAHVSAQCGAWITSAQALAASKQPTNQHGLH
eukprot:4824054-Karenia_brevis.AAC.1